MIRKGKVSEIQKIMTITKACAQKMMEQGIYQWNEHYPNSLAFQEDVKRDEWYVLLEDETIIGCVTISTLKDEEYNDIDWLTKDGLNYYIHRLAVDPDYQGKGYARSLMNFSEGFAKEQGASSIRLDTFSQNTRNQRFYEARGYQKLGNIYFPKQSEYPFYCYELVF